VKFASIIPALYNRMTVLETS